MPCSTSNRVPADALSLCYFRKSVLTTLVRACAFYYWHYIRVPTWFGKPGKIKFSGKVMESHGSLKNHQKVMEKPWNFENHTLINHALALDISP